MSSSTPSQCHPISSPINLLSSKYSHNKTIQANLLLSAAFYISFQTNSRHSTLSRNIVPFQKSRKPCHKVSVFLRNTSQIDLSEQETCSPIEESYSLCQSKSQVKDLAEKFSLVANLEVNKDVDVKLQNISEFNHLLMGLVTADEFELALKLKSNLSSFGLSPDSWTYSIMVTCYCKKNEPKEARNVLDHMLSDGFQPNVATFTTLINSFCQSGRLQDAFGVFDVMSRIGCEPTINTYNCLLKGLCYVGRIEEAYELLTNIKKSLIKPDIYTYTAVMDGFCKVGRSDEALELLDEAVEMGLSPNVVSFNTLFNGYFKEGRPLDGIDLLKQMKESNCKPDYVSYSTLLHGLLKWGKISRALHLYREMVEIGFRVDERMMNTLLRGLCRWSRIEEEFLKDVYEVFDKMRNEEYAVYNCAYDLVIDAFCNAKEVDRALVALDEMTRIGYSPKTITYDNVVRALCLNGEVNKALSVLTLMHKDSKPSRIVFNILIDDLNGQNRPLGACSVYGAALKRGVVPQREPARC